MKKFKEFNESAMDKLRAELRGKIDSQRIGQTVLIYSKSLQKEIDKKVEAAMRRGETKYNKDGSIEWYTDEVVFDPEKAKGSTPSDAYTWDKTGNKVAHDRMLYTKTKDGKISMKKIKRIFKNYS